MRTVNDVITYVNDIKPNAFTEETLTEWLSECEGSIQTEILCIASGDVVTYNYADNKDTELIVKPPHDKLYGFYLLAMIDFAHGEYKKYENTMQLFNAALSEFAKWFVRTHSKEAKNPEGYYMSGYDLAVKHGYSGTEEEWLKTLIGPQGERGIQGEKGEQGIPGKIQSVTSGDNGKILVDGESVVVYDDSEIKEEIGGKVDKASGKGLSSNDYTDAEKNKLANLSNYDDTEIKNDINGKVDKITGKGLSTNDYTDEEKTKLEGLQDGEFYAFNFNYLTEKNESLSGEVMNVGGRVADLERTTQESISQLWGNANTKEDSANKVTTLDSNGTDTQYPSAKVTYDELVKKLNANEAVGKKTEQGGEVFNDYKMNTASGNRSHAEGYNTTAKGYTSHTEGSNAIASGSSSHAEGFNTKASGEYQHVQGKYNKEDTQSKYAHIVGNGSSNSYRSNAHTLDWDGNAWYQGDIRVGGTSYDDGKTVETKTTIIKSTETTASITLADNTETRFAEITGLTVALPETISDSFVSSAVFKSGATATAVTVPSGVYCQGADCKNGAFLPKANKRYTMIFSYDGIMNCYIAAVPIQTAETQSADDFPTANDESVAEPTESVAEEPESEPNEVI